MKKMPAISGDLYRGKDAGLFKVGETGTSDALSIDDCLSNLGLCKDGLSVAFALKGKSSFMSH